MAHFARLDPNNIVLEVLVVANTDEHRGQDFLAIDCGLGGRWAQTSYNTRRGVHTDPTRVAFRKNYAGIGYTFDEQRDAFIDAQPYPSWLLNEETCLWNPPIAYPDWILP